MQGRVCRNEGRYDIYKTISDRYKYYSSLIIFSGGPVGLYSSPLLILLHHWDEFETNGKEEERRRSFETTQIAQVNKKNTFFRNEKRKKDGQQLKLRKIRRIAQFYGGAHIHYPPIAHQIFDFFPANQIKSCTSNHNKAEYTARQSRTVGQGP